MKDSANPRQFRPTRAHIDLAALRHNLGLARELNGPDIGLLAVVKANAYGHGAVPVARTLVAAGVEGLGVATPHEALELREAGIPGPIFLFGGPFGAPADFLLEHDLTSVVFNPQQVQALNDSASAKLQVQLKVDTGMTRLGCLPAEVPEMLKLIKDSPNLELTGVMTHLASADESFEGPTAKQFQIFKDMVAHVRSHYPGLEILHAANSAAILGQQLGGCNWTRPGIMLYGSSPNPRLEAGKRLKPVMHFTTEIVSLKEVSAGTAVSYGGAWVAPRTSRIAVLPVGYADGYLRHLSNVAQVLVQGLRLPVVGRVCMDLSMIDVTDLPTAALGDQVTLWGPGLPAEEVAAWAGTISYELFCAVSDRVPRIYTGEEAS